MPIVKHLDEYLDLVDANDNIIGKMMRSDIYARGWKNYRVVNAFIINSQGQIWIPRRTSTKEIFPNALDVSAGGHVGSGETYDDALRRECLEEVRIDVDKVGFTLLGHMNPFVDGVSCFQNAYEIRSDAVPDFNKNDFSEYFWLTPKEIIGRLEKDDIGKSDLPKLVKRFYLI